MVIRKEQLIDLEQRLIEGIKNSDLLFLDKVLHDDLLFIAPDGQVITKAMDMASHKAGQMVVDEIVSSIEEIKIMNDTAIVIVVYATRGQMLGKRVEGNFRYIRMWKAFGDGVKVIGGSCFKIG